MAVPGGPLAIGLGGMAHGVARTSPHEERQANLEKKISYLLYMQEQTYRMTIANQQNIQQMFMGQNS